MRSFNKTGFLVSAAMLVCSASFGSGFSIFEQGAKATAMGGAFAATADDPSAIFYNVAGIAQQRRAAFMTGGTVINFSNQFRGDDNDSFTSGAKGTYRRHTFIPPNAYALMPIGSNLTVGVGVFSAFGLRTNWQEPFIGRFVSKDANIKTVSVEPAVAWQTSDGKLAIGGGAEYRRAKVILSRNSGANNPFSQHFADVASTYLSSEWSKAWGYNVGILYKPGTWRVGASYRASMKIDFDGRATITKIPTGNAVFDALVGSQLPPSQDVRTSVDFPAMAAIGIATTMIPNWDIEADITHTTWSRFKQLQVNFLTTPAASFTSPQNWENTNSFRLGANHPVTENWAVRLGILYDQNPQPVEVVSPLLPDSDRIGASFGVGYRCGPWVLDATEFALHFKQRSTQGRNSENFNGTYKTDANLISLNLGYRF